MNTDKELMQQALYALEQVAEYFSDDSCEAKTITALRERLAQPYPDNFIDALMYDVAKRDSEAQQAYEDAFVNGTGVMLGDKRIDPASIYKEPEQEPVAWMHPDGRIWTFGRGLDKSTFTIPLYTTTPQRKPLTDERPVSTADELPNGFVPLQKENGRIVYAACMDSSARHYKWLMWLHPDGQWVSKRRLEDWEVMQVEDQEHYGIVQEAAHVIKGDA